jgi:membrane protein DedA with SNARE-associated domain
MMANGILSTPPSELVLAAAGLLVAQSTMPFVAAIIAAALGNLAGASMLFVVTHHWGRPTIVWLLRIAPFSSEAILDRTDSLFAKHGPWLVLVGRCIPNIRSAISVPAALANMTFKKFLGYSTIGIVAWAIAWIGAGYLLGPSVSLYIDKLGLPGAIVAAAFVAVLCILFFRIRSPSATPR